MVIIYYQMKVSALWSWKLTTTEELDHDVGDDNDLARMLMCCENKEHLTHMFVKNIALF